MPDVRAQLIISARDEASAAMRSAGQAVTGVGTAAREASGGFTSFQAAIITLNQGMELASQVGEKLKQVYEATVGAAVDWGETVHKVALISGDSAQEASKMAVVFGDFGMQADSMNMAVKTLTKEGLQFNMRTIEDLATKYQALQDPVQRDQFLFTNFGRSGLDLAEMLSQPVSQLQAMSDQAAISGKVLSGPAADALVAYGIKSKQLGDSVDALKIQVGEGLVPVLSDVVTQTTTSIEAYDLLSSTQGKGIITMSEYQDLLGKLNRHQLTAADVVKDLTAKLAANAGVTQDVTDASDRLALAEGYVAPALDKTAKAAEKAAAAYAAKHDIDKEQLDFMLKQGDALTKNIDAYWKLAAATQEANDKSVVAAGIAGTLTKNTEAYDKVVDSNAEKIGKLRAEILKLTDANGAEIVTVNKGQYSAEQLSVAQERLTIAEERLAGTHSKSKATLDSLALSVRVAQDAVDKMTAHQATSTTTTADNTKKIAEDQAALDLLTGSNAAAVEAMKKANAQFLYQQAAVGLDAAAQLELANSLGIIDTKTYNASKQIETWSQQLRDHKITIEQYTADLVGMQVSLNALQSKDITVSTHFEEYHDTYNTTYSSAHKNAGGGSFIIPPGYNENFPVGPGQVASSGERVTITPAGQSGGADAILAALMTNLPSMIGRAVRDAMQLSR